MIPYLAIETNCGPIWLAVLARSLNPRGERTPCVLERLFSVIVKRLRIAFRRMFKFKFTKAR